LLFQNSNEIINPFRQIKSQFKDLQQSDIQIKFLFDRLHLGLNLLERKGNELSGGERQRIALGRILCLNPKVLILDEPFSAQDPDAEKIFLEILHDLASNNKITIILVAHNIIKLKKLASRILIMDSGKIVENEETQKLFLKPKSVSTRSLLKAAGLDFEE